MDDPGDLFGGRQEKGWIGNTFTVQGGSNLPELPGGVTLRLQVMLLDPNEVVHVAPGSAKLALPLDRVTETVIKASDFSYFRVTNTNGEPRTVVYVLTLSPADPGDSARPGTPTG
jgi:hypothetical protein